MAGGRRTGWRERTPRLALGWRGAKEEPADFGNSSFINMKPSSAECRLTDITELLQPTVFRPLSVSYMQICFTGTTGPVPPLPFAGPVNRQSIKAAPVRRASARRVELSSLLIPLESRPWCLAQKASCVLAEPCMLP